MSKKRDFKIVMVGESGVGKTSIVEKFYSGEFNLNQSSTIGAAYLKASINLDADTVVGINIWDTAGQEKFQSLVPVYLQNADGVIFVLDLTSDNPLQSINATFRNISEQLTDTTQIILAGNKYDLIEEVIDFDPYKKWADDHQTIFVATSAKTGYGVKDLFFEITKKIYNSPAQTISRDTVNQIVGIHEERKEKPKEKGCC